MDLWAEREEAMYEMNASYDDIRERFGPVEVDFDYFDFDTEYPGWQSCDRLWDNHTEPIVDYADPFEHPDPDYMPF